MTSKAGLSLSSCCPSTAAIQSIKFFKRDLFCNGHDNRRNENREKQLEIKSNFEFIKKRTLKKYAFLRLKAKVNNLTTFM